MLEDFLIWLSLAVFEAVEIGGIWFSSIARFEMSKISLDIAGCSTTTRGGESYVGRHDGV